MAQKKKELGQVFTPSYLVEEMLDYVGYKGSLIIRKHIIDNSCGEGAFLKQIVSRYCSEAKRLSLSALEIKCDLETFIHGVEIDENSCAKCCKSLSQIAGDFGIDEVNWNITNGNSLSITKYNGKMDFVVGNPPYVRVHNLDISYDEVKKFNFTHRGMTDIYLAFFELGFGMLNPTGKLCYITPSSWLNSLAASKMREYILQKENLVSLTDLEHFQAFENVTTYTIISLFSNCKKDRYFDYFIFNGNKRNRKYVERLSLESCYINGNFYLSNTKDLQKLKQIKEGNFKRYVSVKNGFATLADKIFIGEHIPKTEITIKVFKASTGKWKDCLFPYNEEGKLLPPTVVFGNPKTKDYFEHHKMELLKGRTEYSTYYEYGRTQAVNDVWRNKIAVNLLIRNEEDLRIEDVVKGKGVYSGLYIISDLRLQANDIKKIIKTPSFVKYVQLLKKYKSGGYYTFNSKDLEQFINYVYFLQNTH